MKDKTKQRILKIVHIISYVMSALFVILCISLGLGSCNARKSAAIDKPIERQTQERVNIDNDTYKYYLVGKSTITTYFNDWEEYELTLTEGCKIFTYEQDYDIEVYIGDNMVYYNNEVVNDKFYSLRFSYWYSQANHDLVCTRIYLWNYENETSFEIYGNRIEWQYRPTTIFIDSLNWASRNLNEIDFNISNFLGLYFDFGLNEGLTYTFDPTKINPIEFYEYEVLSTNVVHNTGSYTGHIDLTMNFVSNGFTFKGMRFQYDYVLGVWANNELTTYNDMTYLALSYIAYQEYYTSAWVKVCYPRIYKYESRTLNNTTNMMPYPMTDFSSYLWTSETYKTIEIVAGGDNVWTTQANEPLANLTNWQILNYKNDLNNNMTSISGIGGFNVFTLLGSAFSSITTLFTLQILPGISFGLLLFLPLIVGIIIAIIWLVKR